MVDLLGRQGARFREWMRRMFAAKILFVRARRSFLPPGTQEWAATHGVPHKRVSARSSGAGATPGCQGKLSRALRTHHPSERG
jgi:hypothetical protein